MKRYAGIDYAQVPASYWADADVLAALLRNVKGRERRQMIRTYWEKGRLEELDEALLRDTVAEEVREGLGRIHPALMGGEYLPDYLTSETEIARLELRSTTGDVVSIRARREGGLIHYRIVDEYDTEFKQQRQSSRSPLTLGELVGFIDGSGHPDLAGGLALCYNDMNADWSGERESLRHFTTVSSGVYPQLAQHYEHVFADWVEESV